MGLAPVSASNGRNTLHAALHGVGSPSNTLRHEQDAVAEIDADDLHAADQRFVQHLVRSPAPVQQQLRPFDDLIPETVVQVVVHLLHQLGIVEFRQDQFFFLVLNPVVYRRFLNRHCHVSRMPEISRKSELDRNFVYMKARHRCIQMRHIG